jgi:hypothetical protein
MPLSRFRFLIAFALTTLAITNMADSLEQNPSFIWYKIITAEEFQKDIEGGQINYDRVDIIGDLDLSNREFQFFSITNSIIDGNASFANSTFYKKVNFRNSSFLNRSLFYKTEFLEEADFSRSHFYQEAIFAESNFRGGGDFDQVLFEKDADFSASNFENFGSFSRAKFYGDSRFELAQFNGLYANFELTQFGEKAYFAGIQFIPFVSFIKSNLGKEADFHGSIFRGGTNFGQSTFQERAKFYRSHFFEDAQFRNMNFSDEADFRNCKFDGPSFFSNTSFGGDALFDQVQFESPSDFSGTQFSKDLSMNGTKISTMLFDGAAFNSSSRLFLSKADINRFMVNWESIKDSLVYDSSAYLSLVKNYKDLGMNEADDCYYQYRKSNQDLKSWGPSKVLDLFAYVTCGYGVRVDRPLICSLFVILGCMIVLWIGNGLKKYGIEVRTTSIYDSLYYCFAIFFTIAVPDIKPVGRYRYIPIFLRALGWLLFALLIATLGKIMIK